MGSREGLPGTPDLGQIWGPGRAPRTPDLGQIWARFGGQIGGPRGPRAIGRAGRRQVTQLVSRVGHSRLLLRFSKPRTVAAGWSIYTVGGVLSVAGYMPIVLGGLTNYWLPLIKNYPDIYS